MLKKICSALLSALLLQAAAAPAFAKSDADKEAAAGVIVRSAADDLSRRLGWSGADPAPVPGTKGGRS